MQNSLFYNTVTPRLISSLRLLMESPLFEQFALVGGTALSLQRGHRISVDIDLFTDAPYSSIDFIDIESYLESMFPYVASMQVPTIGMGKSYYIGESKDDFVKLDLYYSDSFIKPLVIVEGIRMASQEDIIAMKLDVISRGGRKKDYWDIDDLAADFNFPQMIAFHKMRYPYTHDESLIKNMFLNFEKADNDYGITCLKGKIWELIKLDLIEFANK